jgi:hypothetical protein
MDDIQSQINHFGLCRRIAPSAAREACASARRMHMFNDMRNRQALKATFLFDPDAPKPFQLFRILQA